MPPGAGVLVQRLIEECYHPWTDRLDLVQAFCRIAKAATASPWVRIVLAGPDGGTPVEAVWSGRQIGDEDPGGSAPAVSVEVRYQGTVLGTVSVLAAGDAKGGADALRATLAEVAKRLAHHAKRLELEEMASRRFGRSLRLAGPSAGLAAVDAFVEKAARSLLPALLVGEPGADCEAIALMLHLAGPRGGRRCVQLRCAVLEADRLAEQLAECHRGGAAGTLVLSRLEELDARCQRLLCQTLDNDGFAAGALAPDGPVRWVVTASPQLAELARCGGFYRPLLDRLDILHSALPPLRERPLDVGPQWLEALRHLTPQPPGGVCGIAGVAGIGGIGEPVLSALRQYDWPGDVAELGQLAARLALAADGGAITLQHLKQEAPQLLAGRQPPAVPPADRPRRQHHPSIERALAYIDHHFDQRLSLAKVASQAFASASHLAHLFRRETGMTFVQLLTGIRIERAKRLLREDRRQSITAIAGAVGFAELRHFERTFKNRVGLTPREFRQAHAVASSDREPEPGAGIRRGQLTLAGPGPCGEGQPGAVPGVAQDPSHPEPFSPRTLCAGFAE
jgi:AraC-like DNA-binding protein